MPTRKKHFIATLGLFLLVAVIVVVLGKGLTQNPNKVQSAQIGKNAKAFSVSWLKGQEFLKTATGDKITLADLAGRPVILNFWASWCVSCRTEARDLEMIWQKYKDQGLLVVGIAIQDEREAALAFAEKYGKKYILAIDEDGKSTIEYGVHGVPESFLIDAQGVIRHKETGPVTVPMLEKLLPLIMSPNT